VSSRSGQIAIFDLDGTLTWRDTFVPYVAAFLARRPGRWMSVVPAFIAVVLFLCGQLDRDRFKERLIRVCLGGASREEIARCTARFVESVMRGGLRPAAVQAIEQHRAAGDHLVLLSASPDLYVPALATQLGFDECICTELGWNGSVLSGQFVTANRRGEEKVRVVRAMREARPVQMAAYANSSSDLGHLALVERPCLVNASARARRHAVRMGIRCREWR
jgi:phosphatidylglycerophosphatase C